MNILFERVHFYTCTSTNDMAKKYITDSQEMPDHLVITADKQTRGRGSNGKTWWSPEDMGLYASFICKVPDRIAPEILTTIFGRMLVARLRKMFLLDIQQVGINDIYLDDRKLGGILCEVMNGYLIMGIGLNLYRPTKVRKDLRRKSVWLNEYAAESRINSMDIIETFAEGIFYG